jgi:hypothetical protein
MLQQTSKVEPAGHVVQSNRWRSKQSPCRINVTSRRLELSTLTIFHLPAQHIGYRNAPGAAEVKTLLSCINCGRLPLSNDLNGQWHWYHEQQFSNKASQHCFVGGSGI